MFDTMTMTKIVGGFCGALLIFLLGGWAAELILHTGGGHGAHEQAYVIDTGEDEKDAEAEEETGPSFAELFVNADPGKGERVFNKCKACHQTEEGANGAGPYLYGVVGRDVASAEGFSYSGSLAPVVDVWTPQELSEFLANPSDYAPGTTMGFAGLNDAEDRANVIAYLDQTDGDTYEIELPAAEDAPAEDEAGAEETTPDAAADETEEGTAAEAVSAEEPETAEVDPATEAEAAAEQASTDTAADSGAAEGEEMAAGEEAAEDAAAEEDAGGAEDGFAALVAAADPAEGKKAYRQCQACHVADKEQNRVGPHLVDVVGREVASVESFNYSDALKGLGGAWTLDKLNAWLEDPRGFAPGNKMTYSGMRKEEDRASVIAYLQSLAN